MKGMLREKDYMFIILLLSVFSSKYEIHKVLFILYYLYV